ncbi:MAG: hypothetical protein J0L93_01590 [Deltaproteobacteria bacterium]|nr:hypothetical protein [Deltaproteobacteria bacterium]
MNYTKNLMAVLTFGLVFISFAFANESDELASFEKITVKINDQQSLSAVKISEDSVGILYANLRATYNGLTLPIEGVSLGKEELDPGLLCGFFNRDVSFKSTSRGWTRSPNKPETIKEIMFNFRDKSLPDADVPTEFGSLQPAFFLIPRNFRQDKTNFLVPPYIATTLHIYGINRPHTVLETLKCSRAE